MDSIDLLRMVLSMNMLLFLGGLLALGLADLSRRKPAAFRPSRLLRFHYLLLTAALVLPLWANLLPQTDFTAASAQIWAGAEKEGEPQIQEPALLFTAAHLTEPRHFRQKTLRDLLLLTAVVLALAALLFFSIQAAKIRHLLRSGLLLRSRGRVRILASPAARVPLAFRTPGRAWVLIPYSLIEKPEHLRIAVNHELQHHRQGDTFWVYVLALLRFLFFMNPMVHLWIKNIHHTQEFACDEALIDRKKVSHHAYGRCLLKVAAAGENGAYVPVGTTAMARSTSAKLLIRRIDNMFIYKDKTRANRAYGLLALLALGLMAASTLAAQNLIQDRRIDRSQAEVLAQKANRLGGIPVVVNDQVIGELNHYLGTPEGRNFARACIKRLEEYGPLLDRHLRARNLPLQLKAIPFVESGYQNLPAARNPMGAAGLWQFIPATARHYDLRVDEERDERLDIELETRAAMTYLDRLYQNLGDWELALLAYNIGEKDVRRHMQEQGSEDAWSLIHKGFKRPHSYLPKLMAAMIIVANPSLTD